MNKREEVARAICKRAGRTWREPHGGYRGSTELRNSYWFELADAAMWAMYEPNDEMIDEAFGCDHESAPTTYYRAMMDVALRDAVPVPTYVMRSEK